MLVAIGVSFDFCILESWLVETNFFLHLLTVQMEAIAAVTKKTTNTARNVSAWIALLSTNEMSALRQSREFAVPKSSLEMASATTATTMLGVPGTTGIVVVSAARFVAVI